MLNKKVASEIAVGVILLITIVLGIIFWLEWRKGFGGSDVGVFVIENGEVYQEIPQKKGAICTQDAKLCADGSYVSRTGQKCEFAACPNDEILNSRNISPLIKKYDIKEFVFSDSQKISKIEKQTFKVLEHFSVHDKYDKDRNLLSVGLLELGIECGTQKSEKYYSDLLSKFDNNDSGFIYDIYYNGKSNPLEYYTVTVIPNKLNYSNSGEFKEDFGICYAGGMEYPYAVSKNYLLFTASCGSGFGYNNDLPIGCDAVRSSIETTIKVF